MGRRVGPEDAEDVVQATLEEVLASGCVPQLDEDVRRFVFYVARQKIADWHRRRAREARAGEQTTISTSPSLASTADLAHWVERELRPRIDDWKTFEWLLRESEGETLAEIAEADGVRAPTVRQRVSRLRRFLRSRWTQAGLVFALLLIAGAALLRARGSRPGPIAHDKPVIPEAVAPAMDTMPVPSEAPALPPPSASATPRPPPSALHPAPTASPRTAPSAESGQLPAFLKRFEPPAPPRAAPSAEAARTTGFDRAGAAKALGAVSLRNCVTPTTAKGSHHATITFEPDGSVSSVVFDAPFSSALESGCVRILFSKVRVPAFEGEAVRVGKVFALPVVPAIKLDDKIWE